jgi:hypothetical protein
MPMSTFETARTIAEDLLAPTLPRHWRRAQAVGAKAALIGAEIFSRGEGGVLATAAMLIDIGYGPEAADTGFPRLDGARWLRARNWDERVTALVAHCSFAVIEADLRGCREELEAEFPDEDSAVSQALCYCDMTTGPDGENLNVESRIAEAVTRYGPNHVVSRFLERAHPAIIEAVRQTERALAF